MADILKIARELAADNYSGSASIITKFLSALTESQFSRAEFERAFKTLITAHPEMAIIENAYRVLSKVPDEGLATAAQRYIRSLDEAPIKIAEFFSAELPDNAIVMTYSQSSTIAKVILQLHKSGKLGGVILSESRPAEEGKKFAKFLAEKGVRVTLTVDCALGALMEGVDVVVIGADAVTDEYVVNKVGSLALVLLANYHDKPAYSLASTHKLVSRAQIQKFAEGSQIWADAPKGIIVQAPLFEKVPLALLNGVVSERGFMGVQEIEMILE